VNELPLEVRLEAMGLTPIPPHSFRYEDDYSHVEYRKSYTYVSEVDPPTLEDIPTLSIFTRKDGTHNWEFVGLVSTGYRFVGNGELIARIKQMVSADNAILTESFILHQNMCGMQYSVVIANSTNDTRVGLLYPKIVIENSYNGTSCERIHFGIVMEGKSFQFNKFGILKQIHSQGSNTYAQGVIQNYVQVFNTSIGEFVTSNMEKQIPTDTIMKTLDLLDQIGKKRKLEISTALNAESDQGNFTAWNLFSVLARFSAGEQNINVQRFMNNIIERNITIPSRMMELFKSTDRNPGQE